MPNNQSVILSSLGSCTCFAVTQWKLVHVYYVVFCPVPQNSWILCSENASSFSENHRSTLTTKIEKTVAALRICAGASRKKKLLVFPPSAATWLKVLTAGGSRYQSVGAARRGCNVAGEDESHSLTTLSSGSNHSAPGKTYPDVVLPGSPPPPTHIYGPHMGYISWRVGLKVPISSHVHICSPTVHLPKPPVRTEPLQWFSASGKTVTWLCRVFDSSSQLHCVDWREKECSALNWPIYLPLQMNFTGNYFR